VRLSLVLVLLVGCWRNTGNETTPEPEPDPTVEVPRRDKGASCGAVGENVRRIVGTSPDDSLAKRADQIARVVVDRCAIDTWSMELRRCLAGAKTLDDSDGCEKLATPAQQDALEHEIEMMENAD
jgi:hypothetical protein